MNHITWADFQKIDIRVGTIVAVEMFPEARKPAFLLKVDLGDLGIKKSSAQITHLYRHNELLKKQVLCVVNFPPKQIGPHLSEVLITGFNNGKGEIVLAQPDRDFLVPNGSRLI
ncbi:MAG: tRNA-binding protein [Bacteroidota bacterium]